MKSTGNEDILHTSKLYQNLDPQELEALNARAKLVSFSPGEIIIKQGKKSEGIYVLLEGKVALTGQIFGEGRINLASLKSGSIFGGSSVVVKGPNATSVIAETETRCLYLSTEIFEMFSLFYPSMKYKMMKEIAEDSCARLITVANKIMQVMSGMDMKARPIFGEFVKSLTKPSIISYEEASLNIDQLQSTYPISLFNNEQNELLQHAVLVKSANQCILIEEEQVDDASYLVLKGAVQSSIVKNNRVAKISILGPQSFLFPMRLINDQFPSIINYTTCERCILLKFDGKSLYDLQKNQITMWYKLFDLVCESLVVLLKSAEKLDIRINSETYNR